MNNSNKINRKIFKKSDIIKIKRGLDDGLKVGDKILVYGVRINGIYCTSFVFEITENFLLHGLSYGDYYYPLTEILGKEYKMYKQILCSD